MKFNLPAWLAVVLWLAIPGIYFIFLLSNKLDGLFPFFIYLLCGVVSWLMCGASYGVLPSVKAYRETLKQNASRPESGADSNKEKAFGYWKWYAICIILPLVVTIGYHLQWAGYW